MARPRATDYGEKRKAIFRASARLFAERGYDGTSMSQIAVACGVSKALLYHYYDSKETLLYDIIFDHLNSLLATVEAAAARDGTRADRLTALTIALLDAYRDSDAEHKVQINDLKRLPSEAQEELRGMERDLVEIFSRAIADAAPSLAGDSPLLKPVTMSLFGMLNWHFLWFRPDGAISRDDYARLATRLVVDGVAGLKIGDL